MAEKATKAKANYRAGTANRRCALCTMFRPPESCTAVKGEIRKSGVCDYFERAGRKGRDWYGKSHAG